MPRARRKAANGCRITAAICVERADDTAWRAAASLVQQSLSKDEYEILVLGDGEALAAAGPAAQPLADVPNLRRIEARSADSTDVRNRALHQARAPLVAFLGAHAVAEPDWLACLCRTFEQFGEVAQCVGGRVRPLWEAPRPAWLGDDLLVDLSLVDLGGEVRFLAADERLSVVNIAFRRGAATAIGWLPAVGDGALREALARGDARQPVDRNPALAGRAVYDPAAAVDYLVPAHRLCQQWFRGRAAWRAVADLMRITSPDPVALDARWQAVKDFFFECPPTERTIRGLALRQDDPQRFQRQIAAIYDSIFCLLGGIGESDYD